LLNKNWRILSEDSSLDLQTRLLHNRGLVEKNEIEQFFTENFEFHDPFLMKDMDKAVKRILSAIENGEKIVIFGDYDVDGISGSAILIQTLRFLSAKVSYRIPHRMKDGYGLNVRFVKELADLGVDLIITVDNGISCKKEIDLAKSLKIDVIVTDHHGIPEEFPVSAFAVVHPGQSDCEYPFKDLSGSCIAFKLAKALLKTKNNTEATALIENLFDLASLGAVADCTSLLGENRFIVKKGLRVLHDSRWRGLSLISQNAGVLNNKKSLMDLYDTDVIGFRIGPRINAASRIDDPYFALQALIDEGGKAEFFAQKLEELNNYRQNIVKKALENFENIFAKDLDQEFVCIAEHQDWSSGIVGLIAGKITDKYGKPSFVMEDRGDVLVGSARSPEYFDVFEAINHVKKYLENFGGHKQAAGFTLKKENLAKFKKALKEFAKNKLVGKDLRPVLNIDAVLNAEDLNMENFRLIEKFAPFGMNNPKPLFLLKNAKIQNPKLIGNGNKHLSFGIFAQNKIVRAIAFSFGEFAEKILKKDQLDIVFHLEENEWNFKRTLQARIVDIRESF